MSLNPNTPFDTLSWPLWLPGHQGLPSSSSFCRQHPDPSLPRSALISHKTLVVKCPCPPTRVASINLSLCGHPSPRTLPIHRLPATRGKAFKWFHVQQCSLPPGGHHVVCPPRDGRRGLCLQTPQGASYWFPTSLPRLVMLCTPPQGGIRCVCCCGWRVGRME